MQRLTIRDWQTINSALAHLEAEADDEAQWGPGEDEDQFIERLAAVREKVHERL